MSHLVSRSLSRLAAGRRERRGELSRLSASLEASRRRDTAGITCIICQISFVFLEHAVQNLAGIFFQHRRRPPWSSLSSRTDTVRLPPPVERTRFPFPFPSAFPVPSRRKSLLCFVCFIFCFVLHHFPFFFSVFQAGAGAGALLALFEWC